MRTLRRNQELLWVVDPVGKIPKLDRDGYPTGEFTVEYSTPKQIRLALYPSLGDVVRKMFGEDMDIAYLSLADSEILTKDSLLFYTKPTEKFDTTYDLKVKVIKKSLNHWNYGLEFR